MIAQDAKGPAATAIALDLSSHNPEKDNALNADGNITVYVERRGVCQELTPPEHQHTEAVIVAAQWLASEPNPPQPVIGALRPRFGLTALEACEAAALARRFRLEAASHQ